MRIIILAAALVIPLAAHAQTISCGPANPWCGTAPERAPSGNANLDRAIAICDAHRITDGLMQTVPETLRWQSGYEACAGVSDAWEKSKAAAVERERQRKEDADRAFVNDFAKHLDPKK